MALLHLEEAGRNKDRHIGEVKAANAGLQTALSEMTATASRSGKLLVEHADRTEQLHLKTRTLERQLREAMRDEKTVDLDAPLPPDAAFALCLRWYAASTSDAGSVTGNTPADSDAGKSNPQTGIPEIWHVPDPFGAGNPCAGWENVSTRDALEWAGTLLDHAGAERLDKAALREWAQKPEPEKNKAEGD